MAVYTTQIKSIVEFYANSDKPLLSKVDDALPMIFNFDYPIWSNSYKTTLERKIILHYIMHEIGFETVALWKMFLNQRLNEIMPYYNDLYNSTTFKFLEPYDVNITETIERVLNGNDTTNTNINNSSNSKSNSNVIGLTKNLNLAYPQTQVEGNPSNLFYGTDGNKLDENSTSNTTQNNTSTNSSETKGKSQTTEKMERTQKGNNTTPWDVIEKYRKSIINIDKMIINDLKDLFMMVY